MSMIKRPTAKDYMSSPVYRTSTDTLLDEVDRRMQEQDVSALVVEDHGGMPVGVISRSDLIAEARGVENTGRYRTLELPEKPAGAAMTHELVFVQPDEPLGRLARMMSKQNIHRVFVQQDDVLLGVVATHDIVRAVRDTRLTTPLAEVMSKSLVTVRSTESMDLVVERLNAAHKHGLVVLDGEWPVGVITQRDLLIAQHWPATSSVEDWMSPRVLCLPAAMPSFRAAAHALAMNAAQVLVMSDKGLDGIATGIDFARSYARDCAKSEAA
jgi:CBS domain-containing protein